MRYFALNSWGVRCGKESSAVRIVLKSKSKTLTARILFLVKTSNDAILFSLAFNKLFRHCILHSTTFSMHLPHDSLRKALPDQTSQHNDNHFLTQYSWHIMFCEKT